MNVVRYKQTGGFPLDTNNLDFLQNSFHILNMLGNLAGDMVIISGCETTGNTVSNGVVYVNKEVLEFRGGSLSANVFIKEETVSGTFEDGSFKPIEITRYVTFGSSTPEKTFKWEDFKRIKNLIQLEAEKATKTALEELKKELSIELKKHIDNKENPHGVKREQLGILRVGSIQIGNIVKSTGTRYENAHYIAVSLENDGYDELIRISFKAPLKTSNYIVVGNFTSYSGYWNNSNDISFITHNKTTNSFDLGVREYSPNTQSLQFDFVIMSLD